MFKKTKTIETVDLSKIVNLVVKNFLVVMLATIIGALLGFASTYLVDKKYSVRCAVSLAYNKQLEGLDPYFKAVKSVNAQELTFVIQNLLEDQFPDSTYEVTNNKNEYPINIIVITNKPEEAKAFLEKLPEILKQNELIKMRTQTYVDTLKKHQEIYKSYQKQALTGLKKVNYQDKAGYINVLYQIDSNLADIEYQLNVLNNFVFVYKPRVTNNKKPVVPYIPLYVFLGATIGFVGALGYLSLKEGN